LCFNTFNHSAYLGLEPDLLAEIDAAAAAGFRLLGPDRFTLDAWTQAGGDLDALNDRMAARNMQCWEIAAAVFLTDSASSLAEARHVAAMARVLRPKWVQINVGVPIDETSIATLSLVCEVIIPTGARVAIEYLPTTPLNCLAQTRRLVEQIGSEQAGILIDVWHHFRGPDTYAELDATPLGVIAYVQFDDALPVISNDLVDEMLHRRTFPGEGEFDIEAFCNCLRRKGFDGVVSVEILSDTWRRKDLGEFARRAYETSAKFWPQHDKST
jgi:sugar phosphate isomerase/epimerase